MAGGEDPVPRRPGLAMVTDAATYVAVVVVGLTLLSTPASFAVGADLVGVKYALFFAGFLQVGLAVVRIWPTDPDDVEVTDGRSPDEETRFQRAVQRLVVASLRAPPRYRLATPYRLLLAGVATLAVSMALEFLLGVPG